MENTIYIVFSEKRITERGRVVLVTERDVNQRNIETIKVANFEDAVVKVAKFAIQNAGRDFIIDLNDAETHLAIAAIIAFLLTEIKAYITINNEQLTTADISPLKIALTQDHIEIIKAIDEGFISTTSIARRTNIPQTTVWRRLKELRKENIIDARGHLTYKGRLLLKIFS